MAAKLLGYKTRSTSALDSILESLAALGVPEVEWDAFLEETLLSLRGWAGIIQQIEARGDRVPHAIPAGTLTEFLAVRLLLERFALTEISQNELGYTGPLTLLQDELRKRLPLPSTSSEEQRAFSIFHLAQVLAGRRTGSVGERPRSGRTSSVRSRHSVVFNGVASFTRHTRKDSANKPWMHLRSTRRNQCRARRVSR